MALSIPQISEINKSRALRTNHDGASSVLKFLVDGSNDLDTMWTALWGSLKVPTTVDDPVWSRTMYVDSISADCQSDESWLWSLTYTDAQVDTGDYTYSFSTTGGTARITTSLETVSSYSVAGKSAPDFKQAIGLTREGDVQGVDIVVPAMKFTMSYRQPYATLTMAYVRTLELLTGTVNNATFYGRAAGEVLFMGAEGRQSTGEDPTIDYHFLRMPNLTGQTIGDITGVAKLGHEHLWVIFEEEEDATAKWLPKRPRAAYVERIYDLSNFANIGVGVS